MLLSGAPSARSDVAVLEARRLPKADTWGATPLVSAVRSAATPTARLGDKGYGNGIVRQDGALSRLPKSPTSVRQVLWRSSDETSLGPTGPSSPAFADDLSKSRLFQRLHRCGHTWFGGSACRFASRRPSVGEREHYTHVNAHVNTLMEKHASFVL